VHKQLKMQNKKGHHTTQHIKITQELLDKFYNNSCTAEEITKVETWFTDVENINDITEKVKPVWEKAPLTGNKNKLLENVLYKIHYNININKLKKEKKNSLWLKGISAAVMIGIVLFAVGYGVGSLHSSGMRNMYSRLYAPYGSRIRFELPDGSRGWLNSGSSLKYPVRFTGKNRKVFLKGEGYFDVKHNPDKPFIVQTSDTRVTALGTSFNVMAYVKGNEREITLIKGVVIVDKKLPDNSYEKVLTMKPGQHVNINAGTGKVITKSKDSDKYVAWKDGILMFRNDPLSRVIKEMELFYNVNIEVANPVLYKYHFHATFEDETLFEALRLLKISSAIEYKICKREKNKDGTFKKRKVILYAKK